MKHDMLRCVALPVLALHINLLGTWPTQLESGSTDSLHSNVDKAVICRLSDVHNIGKNHNFLCPTNMSWGFCRSIDKFLTKQFLFYILHIPLLFHKTF